MKGLIALDIDGTLTEEMHSLPKNVAAKIDEWSRNWEIFFVTGRTFKWVFPLLSHFTFNYRLGLQNGALNLEMPARKVIGKAYLTKEILKTLDQLLDGLQPDYAIFAGYEEGDKVYYRPSLYHGYIRERAGHLLETWVEVKNWDQLPFDSFASLKWIGTREKLHIICQRLEKIGLHIPVNRDPVNSNYCVAQATNPEATKGQLISKWREIHHKPIIAAGDDRNDFGMLSVADVKVVMQGAPEDLIEMADVIAKPAKQEGIIQGIEKGIEIVCSKYIL